MTHAVHVHAVSGFISLIGIRCNRRSMDKPFNRNYKTRATNTITVEFIGTLFKSETGNVSNSGLYCPAESLMKEAEAQSDV